MDPVGPRGWFFTEVSIRRTPSAYSTVVCSAAFTSRPLEAFAGRTSTVVSARSAAMNWTRPAGMRRTAEIGAGVSNFCIVCSLCCVVSDTGNATLLSRFLQQDLCLVTEYAQVEA